MSRRAVRTAVPSLEMLFVGAFALLGVRLGAVPIGDNSAFWHIRTGIDIVGGLGVPTRDPYSWTSAGTPWVVQSWLAEVGYGVAHAVAGMGGIVALNALLMGLIAGLTATMARTGAPRRTFVAGCVAVGMSAGWWSPRPLLFGLALLGVTVLAAERGWAWWWLVPVGALWVNVHGSFVLGPAWVVLAALGGAADRRWRHSGGRPGPVVADLRRLGGLVSGVMLGAALSPVGWRLLVFPLAVLERREAFGAVIEWQPPQFLGGRVQILAAACVALTVAVVVAKRPPLRLVAPAVVFLIAGALSQRNMAAAGLVAAPLLGHALRPRPGADGGGRGAVRQESVTTNAALAAVLVLAAVLFVAMAAAGRGVDPDGYPVAALSWLDANGYRRPGARLAHTDVVGGWIILQDGRSARVFIDDRVDMYPLDLLADYRAMLAGTEAGVFAVERRRVDALLWDAGSPLVERLRGSGEWRVAYRDPDWVVLAPGRG